MRLSILGFFLLLLAVDLVPALVIVYRIVVRARAAGVPAAPHVVFAFFGGLNAGIIANGALAQYFLFRAQQMDPFPFRWQVALMVAGGVFGSAVVAGAVYLRLRMVTQRDPDYEELPGGPDTKRDGEPGA